MLSLWKRLRVVSGVFLICTALTMAMLTFSGFTAKRGGAAAAAASGGTENAASYVLGESDGNVAVYAAGDRQTPVTVTNIELATLREADSSMIRAGLVAGSESELLQLLEDLGS